MAAAGAPGVPAGVPLQADLALLSWKHVEDLSGDGGVIKKTVHDPEGWDVRTPGRPPPAPRLPVEGGCRDVLRGFPSASPWQCWREGRARGETTLAPWSLSNLVSLLS